MWTKAIEFAVLVEHLAPTILGKADDSVLDVHDLSRGREDARIAVGEVGLAVMCHAPLKEHRVLLSTMAKNKFLLPSQYVYV